MHVSRLSHLPLIPVVRSEPRRPPDHLLDQPSHFRRPVGRSRRSGLESSSGSCGRLDHGSQGTKLLVGMDEEREFRRTLVLASQAFEATRGVSIQLLQMESRRMQMASKPGDRQWKRCWTTRVLSPHQARPGLIVTPLGLTKFFWDRQTGKFIRGWGGGEKGGDQHHTIMYHRNLACVEGSTLSHRLSTLFVSCRTYAVSIYGVRDHCKTVESIFA